MPLALRVGERRPCRKGGGQEAAWELLEEALQPFIDEMTRYVELTMEKQALEMCQGILLGLYRLRDAEDHEVLQWAADFPFEAASRVAKT